MTTPQQKKEPSRPSKTYGGAEESKIQEEGRWQSRFDERFHLSLASSIEHDSYRREKIKSFIAETLREEKEEWKRRVEGIKKVINPDKLIPDDVLTHTLGYNRALSDVLAILD